MDNLIQDVRDWARKPYDDSMDLLDWVLFIGLLTVMTILWTRVIKRLVD